MYRIYDNHPKDKLIYFDDINHEYFYLTNPKPILFLQSVTGLLNEFFPFDGKKISKQLSNQNKSAEDYEKEWENSAKMGTKLHKLIERYKLKNIEPNRHEKQFRNELSQFLKYNDRTKSEMKVVKTEWKIFDTELNIAGSIDQISCNKNGQYIIEDWKRTKHKIIEYPFITDKEHLQYQNKFISSSEMKYTDAFKDFEWKNIRKSFTNSNETTSAFLFIKYAIQLQLYNYILEKSYNLTNKCLSMHIVRLYQNVQCSIGEVNNIQYESIISKMIRTRIEAMFEKRKKTINSILC